MSRLKMTVISIVVAICFIFSLLAYFVPPIGTTVSNVFSKISTVFDQPKSDNYVVFTDDTNGGCSLICSKGKYFLINCGNDDTAQSLLVLFENHKIKKLEFIIFTNPLVRNCEGFSVISKEISIGRIFVSGIQKVTTNNSDYSFELLTIAEKQDIPVRYLTGKESFTVSGATFEVFPALKEHSNLYDRSAIIKLTLCGKSVLFTDAVSIEREKEIYEENITADCLFISSNLTFDFPSDALLEAIDPKTVVLTARSNSKSDVLDSTSNDFISVGIRLYNTDITGCITLLADKDGELVTTVSPDQTIVTD